MSIDLKTIKHISKLSRISVDEKKAEKLAGDLNSIFKFIEKLNELKTDNIQPLAIGDNLRTDIKGANNLKIDCIFITEGVHRKEFNNFSGLNKLLGKYSVKANFFQKELKW